MTAKHFLTSLFRKGFAPVSLDLPIGRDRVRSMPLIVQRSRRQGRLAAHQCARIGNEDRVGNLLTGIVEMDETYVGGKPRKGTKGDGPGGKHKPGRGTKKAPVIGAVERGGSVTAKAVSKDKLKGKNLRAFVRERVDTKQASLITDEYKGYLGMAKVLPHEVIKHQAWYVDGDIHTNTIEGFWALLKRGMFGQFHSVSRKHLQRYVDEFCYRYNLRNANPFGAFDLTINRGLGVAQ